MKRIKTLLICACIITILLAACGPPGQQSPPEPTILITEASSPALQSSPTQPTATLQPPTATATHTPTFTPTILPTQTPLPSDTPTVTSTPGPFSLLDDFSTESDAWGICEMCSWKDGTLVMGPFAPTSNFHKNYCTGCGARPFYKISVEATFLDGQVDRFFGVFLGDANGKQYYFGISPWQFYIIGQHTDENDTWNILDAQWSGTVNASYATNKFEVKVQPAYKKNTADYLFSLNGSVVFILYAQPVVPSRAGLAMDWHAVTVGYDNWNYEEIER